MKNSNVKNVQGLKIDPYLKINPKSVDIESMQFFTCCDNDWQVSEGTSWLRWCDMLEGTTLLPLISNKMNYDLLDWCLMDLAKMKRNTKNKHYITATGLLGKFIYPFTKPDRRKIMKRFGKIQDTLSFIEIGRTATEDLWMQIHGGGFHELSEMILDPPRGIYCSPADQLNDLKRAQLFASINREYIASMSCELYYDESDLHEIAYHIYNQPTNTILSEQGRVSIGKTADIKNRYFLFHAGMKNGSYLIHANERNQMNRNHLRRIRGCSINDEEITERIQVEIKGIHCADSPGRIRYLSEFYETMPGMPRERSIHLSPVYNFRPMDIPTLERKYS